MNYLFNLDEEDDLEETCMRFSRGGFPLDGDKLRILAYELAIANGRSGFSLINPLAGHTWLTGFLDRKPEIKEKKWPKIVPFLGLGVQTQPKLPNSLMSMKVGLNNGTYSTNPMPFGMLTNLGYQIFLRKEWS